MSGMRKPLVAGVLAVSLFALAACGKSASSSSTTSAPAPSGSGDSAAASSPAAPTTELATTTPAGSGELESATWAAYRDVQTVDPLYVFDYPDNTAMSLICEALSLQAPDGTITDGLAKFSQPNETTLVYDINPAAKFWDGSAVTADDVVYSLKRQMNPELGGFYGQYFDRVKDMKATTASQVTITLTKPDYVLPGALSSTPGMIVQKKFAESAGEKFGTGEGGVMCSGSFTNKGWKAGEGAVFTRNDAYWNTNIKPLTKQIKIIGVVDPTALNSGLIAGDITGTYINTLGAVKQLEGNSAVTITKGVSYVTDAFITSTGNGVLTDPVVRKALSLAIDRKPYIDTALEGFAVLPRMLASSGTFGYGKEVFDAAYSATPEMTQDLEAAKKLVEGKGLAGKSITIGMIQVPAMAAEANAVKAAAEALGLKAELKVIAPDAYINLFIDPEFRKDVDGWFTLNYPDYANPGAIYSSFALPKGSQNYVGYDNPKVTEALEAARSAADPNEQAKKVVEAGQILIEEQPWIPMSMPYSMTITGSGVTGETASFSYMFAPWANALGTK